MQAKHTATVDLHSFQLDITKNFDRHNFLEILVNVMDT